ERLKPALQEAEAQAAQAREERDRAEQAAAEQRRRESEVREKLSEAQRRHAVAAAGIDAAVERQQTLSQRAGRMKQEREGIEAKAYADAGEKARAEVARLREEVAGV